MTSGEFLRVECGGQKPHRTRSATRENPAPALAPAALVKQVINLNIFRPMRPDDDAAIAIPGKKIFPPEKNTV